MDDKEQKFKTYRSLSDMHRFRLRLFAEGILTGIFAGIVISFFRFALSEMEYLRGALYNRLWVSDWSINACWFAVLIAIAFILHKLNCIEPMAAGSGIPQVKGAILGLMKMRWLHILWVKLTAGIIGIGAGLSLGREGRQPSYGTHPHGGTLSADQRCQRRSCGSLQRSARRCNLCFGGAAPQFFHHGSAAFHGSSLHCDDYFTRHHRPCDNF